MQNLTLSNDEIARLREKDLNNLLRDKKLYLVLDLDHTLLHSTRLSDISAEEQYLKDQGEALPGTIFSLVHLLPPIRFGSCSDKKLEHPLLVQKSSLQYLNVDILSCSAKMFFALVISTYAFRSNLFSLFEMYIYTMGSHNYALEMEKLLDPGGVYFPSRVIAQGDSTQRHQKDLDVVIGKDSAVLILDDTEALSHLHEDLIAFGISIAVIHPMQDIMLWFGASTKRIRYHFFASSCRHFGSENKSLSEVRSDENEMEGALSSVLSVLKKIHERGQNLYDRDVRQCNQSKITDLEVENLKNCKLTQGFQPRYLAKRNIEKDRKKIERSREKIVIS
ncbi:hypothetical protein RND71_016788 [Anisodus tanguticus]|uniref:protein-serine/threonine phosphatase n=1 Tax=Anisodus tanguticus TaxID=243964 RepID=A0AAE1S8I4_9SOLA|nr:hypothetical protein RND71_016788 [Anisodus tanguticus]